MPWASLYKIAKTILSYQQNNKLFSCLCVCVEGLTLLQLSVKRWLLYYVFMNVADSGQFQADGATCSQMKTF